MGGVVLLLMLLVLLLLLLLAAQDTPIRTTVIDRYPVRLGHLDLVPVRVGSVLNLKHEQYDEHDDDERGGRDEHYERRTLGRFRVYRWLDDLGWRRFRGRWENIREIRGHHSLAVTFVVTTVPDTVSVFVTATATPAARFYVRRLRRGGRGRGTAGAGAAASGRAAAARRDRTTANGSGGAGARRLLVASFGDRCRGRGTGRL